MPFLQRRTRYHFLSEIILFFLQHSPHLASLPEVARMSNSAILQWNTAEERVNAARTTREVAPATCGLMGTNGTDGMVGVKDIVGKGKLVRWFVPTVGQCVIPPTYGFQFHVPALAPAVRICTSPTARACLPAYPFQRFYCPRRQCYICSHSLCSGHGRCSSLPPSTQPPHPSTTTSLAQESGVNVNQNRVDMFQTTSAWSETLNMLVIWPKERTHRQSESCTHGRPGQGKGKEEPSWVGEAFKQQNRDKQAQGRSWKSLVALLSFFCSSRGSRLRQLNTVHWLGATSRPGTGLPPLALAGLCVEGVEETAAIEGRMTDWKRAKSLAPFEAFPVVFPHSQMPENVEDELSPISHIRAGHSSPPPSQRLLLQQQVFKAVKQSSAFGPQTRSKMQISS